VPQGFSKSDDHVRLHYGQILTQAVTIVSWFKVTTPIQTIIDVAGVPGPNEQIDSAIDDALGSNLFTVIELREQAEVFPVAALAIEQALRKLML
jgi:hypothetical protein